MPSFSDLISGRFGGGVNDPGRRTSNNGSGRSGTVSRSVTRAAPNVGGGGSSYSAPTNVPSPARKPTSRMRNTFSAQQGSSSADRSLGRSLRAKAGRAASPGIDSPSISSRFADTFEDVKGGFPKYTSLLQPRTEASAARVAASSRSNIDDKTVLSGASRSVPRSRPSVDNVTRPGRGPSLPQSKPRATTPAPTPQSKPRATTPAPTPQRKPATPAARVKGTFRETMFGVEPDLQDVLRDRAMNKRKPGIF